MINFGYWTQVTTNIKQAQKALSTLTGNLAELETAKNVLDIGSGLSGPAQQWNLEYKSIDSLICIDVNYGALKISLSLYGKSNYDKEVLVEPIVKTEATNKEYITNNQNVVMSKLSRVNATATCLPLGDSFVDRIIALESAQHFKFLEFIRESHRVLKKSGLIVVAIPVITSPKPNGISKIKIFNSLRNLRVLGILSLTWASQHYEFEQIKSVISQEHFVIKDILKIGKSVYIPLTDFYIQDRKEFRKSVLGINESFLKKIALDITERIVYRSALKMKKLSLSGDIDYVLIKATKK